jgi:ribonuclease HI
LYITIALNRNPCKIAIAFILYNHVDEKVQRTMRFLKKNDTTNNKAYYHALIDCPSTINMHMGNEIVIFTNSEVISKQM